jgi:GT2 family glycosyltransferase
LYTSILLFYTKKTMPNKLAKLTIIIPTRPNIENIKWIFKSLDIQTFQDFKIILLIDSRLTETEFKKLKIESLKWIKNINKKINFISNINTDFVPQSWVSYVRNYGIKLVDTKFINLFDDDEVFKKNYIQKSFDLRNQKREELQKDFVLVPTLMFRKTWQIQSQWFDYYNFWLSRPHALWLNKKQNQKFAEIQMFSWNSLFGPTKIFQKVLFDEQFDFVYEDLEFTYRLHKSWHPILVTSDLVLYHMERDKNTLEHARVWSTFAAYRKAKHRVLFVTKNWTTSDKIKFYLFWFLWQPSWLVFKILFFAKKGDIWPLISSLIKWTIDWLKSKNLEYN